MRLMREHFTFYDFPTGRRLFAMRELAAIAETKGLVDIQGLAEAAAEQAAHTAAREADWRRARTTTVGRRKRAGEVDAQMDRTLGALLTHLETKVHAFSAKRSGALASELIQQLFPAGAAAITSMTYEDELAACEVLYGELQARPEHVEALGLGDYVEQLGELIPAYREALTQESTRELSHDEVRAAQREGQELMLRAVAKVLGEFGGPGEEHQAMRQQLLGAVYSQQRRMREHFANRRGVRDIDPETGEELTQQPDNPEPASGSANGPSAT